LKALFAFTSAIICWMFYFILFFKTRPNVSLYSKEFLNYNHLKG